MNKWFKLGTLVFAILITPAFHYYPVQAYGTMIAFTAIVLLRGVISSRRRKELPA